MSRIAFWGSIAGTAQLPNVAGATIQSAQLLVGHNAYNTTDSKLYTCTVATVGAGVWKTVSTGATGRTLWVDSINGNDSTAAVGTLTLPYLTLQAAITASSSGDVVLVLPGDYNELNLMKAGVDLRGLDRDRCRIVRTSTANETIITMAGFSSVTELSLLITVASAVTATAFSMSSTMNGTAAIRDVFHNTVASGGGTHVFLACSGTAALVASPQWVAVERCLSFCTGNSTLIAMSGAGGVLNVADSYMHGLVSISCTAGTVNLRRTGDYIGITCIAVSAGATVNIEAGVSLGGAVAGPGSINRLGLSRQPNPMTVNATSTVAIDNVTPTIIATLAAMQIQSNQPTILFTGQFENTAVTVASLSLRLFRDAVEILATDRYDCRMEILDDGVTFTVHWTDTTLLLNAPVYTVRALGSVLGINALANRRMTARF